MDNVDRETRSRMMSRIRSTNTKPEILVRKGLFALGFRYRLYNKEIRGKPDLLFRKYRALVFVHGCFWHGHLDCPNFRLPSTNTEFWTRKIDGNRKRDGDVLNRLRAEGWRIAIVWECALRGKNQRDRIPETIQRLADWLVSDRIWLELRGPEVPGIPERAAPERFPPEQPPQ